MLEKRTDSAEKIYLCCIEGTVQNYSLCCKIYYFTSLSNQTGVKTIATYYNYTY
jgi:hypothetical protein